MGKEPYDTHSNQIADPPPHEFVPPSDNDLSELCMSLYKDMFSLVDVKGDGKGLDVVMNNVLGEVGVGGGRGEVW